jgi:cation diffusion facilitator family transporter
MESSLMPSKKELKESRLAMRVSLLVGFLMLGGKLTAYLITGSMAIFSDAAESFIHQIAVVFAAFSLHLSTRPADNQFTHGYERISFFSAGFEGALIMLAAITIIYTSINKWIGGLDLTNLNTGTLIIAAAGLVNLWVGLYLVRIGKRQRSLILEANGKHVLSDSWTSLGVVAGLVLVLLTGWMPFDPICAIIVALNILWSGGKLVFSSIGGLMDYTDPEIGKILREKLKTIEQEFNVSYHRLRYRHTGYRLKVELHLLFPFALPVGRAHQIATEIENRLSHSMEMPTEITTHLESREDHSEIHVQGSQLSSQ